MDTTSRILQIQRWELKAVAIEFIIFTGVVMGLTVGYLSHLSMFLWIPFNVLIAIGLGALGLVLLPVQSLLARAQGARRLSPRSRIVWCVISAFVYLAISSQMQ